MKYRACVLLGVVILSIGAWSAWPDAPLPSDTKVDLVVVRKSARHLELYRSGQMLVMIHGMKNGWGWLGRLHRLVDWTDGCVAVTDREMDEIWRVVPDGTRIVLKP